LPPPSLLDTVDRTLFPSELFPGLERYSRDELLLRGLAAQYPGRVVYEAPASSPAVTPETGPTPRRVRTATLPGGIEYIRCYANGDDEVPVPVPSSDSRIIDLRYFSTGTASVTACARLCEKLIGVAPGFNAQGKYPLGEVPKSSATEPKRAVPLTPKITVHVESGGLPASAVPRVFVLVNHATSGPIEAMLDDLQERGKIILVGSATAGRTAALAALKGHPGWQIIVGEIQLAHPRVQRPKRNPELSIVGIGVQPEVHVHATPQMELLAWQRVESGESPAALLRSMASSVGAPSSSNSGNNTGGKNAAVSLASHHSAPDAPLRRAHDILTALQVMGEIAPSVTSPTPPSPPPADSTIPSAQPDLQPKPVPSL
jgi:hypothetical protein